MKQITKRLLSFFLCFAMVVSMLPALTLKVEAANDTSGETVVTEEGNDFPEYPNQGAIRFDKTAQAVGTFSQTGMSKVELSMTGVPYSTGSEIDVVLVLDASNSMTLTYNNVKGGRLKAAKEAAYELVKQIILFLAWNLGWI